MDTRLRIACVQLRARGVEEADAALGEALEGAARAARDADLVVLPEATYPGYVLHDATPWLDPATWDAARDALAGVARDHGAWIAAGLVRPLEGALANSAVLLAPDGTTEAIADKAFLWHFDERWFRRGAPGDVAALPWGPVGMIVCADVRMTELPRRLALGGARLLLDPTALVLSAAGTNAQVEYMLGARAWENGVFLAVANKCGAEAGIARYAGRSAIFGPDGGRLAEAGPDEPEIVVAEVDLTRAPGPPAQPSPAGYPMLTRPFEGSPIAEVLSTPPPVPPLRLAMLRAGTDADRPIRELGADLGVGRRVPPGTHVVATGTEGFVVGGKPARSGDVVRHGAVRIGLLAGDRLAVPEEARSLVLEGASLIVWDGRGDVVPEGVVRTRADENRVFLLALLDDDGWRLYGPSGDRMAEGPQPGLDAVLVDLPLALAWQKEMAPGTDVVRHRPAVDGSPA